MGMFDWILMDFTLPAGYEDFQGHWLQTKDLDSTLEEYKITTEGRLLKLRPFDWHKAQRIHDPIDTDYAGELEVTGYIPVKEWYVRFFLIFEAGAVQKFTVQYDSLRDKSEDNNGL